MHQQILDDVNDNEFFNYLKPFVDKANTVKAKKLNVVNDGYKHPKLLWLKVALVLELPWYYKHHCEYFKTKTSTRDRLFVSDNTNLYIEREQQIIEYDFKWKWFKRKLHVIKRTKEFTVFEANADMFREFVLWLKYYNMLTDELKKCLIRDG